MQLQNEVRRNSVRQEEGKEAGRVHSLRKEEALHAKSISPPSNNNPNVSDANITTSNTCLA